MLVATWRFLMTAMVASTVCVSVATVTISVVPKKRVLVEETTTVVGTMMVSVEAVTTSVVPMTSVMVAVEVVVSRTVLVPTEPAAPDSLTVKVEVKTPEVGAVTVTVAVLEKIVSEKE